jgi:DEAD/DEAH box helicase domain-containing protein
MTSLVAPSPDGTVTSDKEIPVEEHSLMKTLRLLDPVIQFLTKATGFTSVALLHVRRTLPSACFDEQTFYLVQELAAIGILHLFLKPSDEHNGDYNASSARWDDIRWQLGFSSEYPLLQGCTKTAAKRRVAALKKMLKERKTAIKKHRHKNANQSAMPDKVTEQALVERTVPFLQEPQVSSVKQDNEVAAREAFHLHFQLDYLSSESESKPSIDSNPVVEHILPGQLAWAETFPAQEAVHADLSTACLEKIPSSVLISFQLSNRKLFSHQSRAIESTLLHKRHTAICTGTGSGKSLCFWLPVTSAAIKGETSLVIFPTKALAQDQLIKLQSTLEGSLLDQVSPATLDGDSPMSRRCSIVETAKILLTNPDTIHASLLSSKDKAFKSWLSKLRYVVLDEAHTYDGVFGAHVAMILRRLIRVVAASGRCEKVTFMCASATLPQPEIHFRRLCPVGDDEVTIIVDDCSPRAAKHFFVWNPPLLWRHMDGRVEAVLNRRHASEEVNEIHNFTRKTDPPGPVEREHEDSSRLPTFTRRHAADETALLFARLVQRGVRCIVFCKTRNLVEWVFEKASKVLGEKDCKWIESYRGGYTLKERREIERKLFSNQLMGVISTNALELGVDVGAIDVTLHCGYPSSYTSLMQQAGRAGRGLQRTPSLSVMVCFGSVTEQYIWRHPKTLLGKRVDAAVVLEDTTSPMTTIALLQGHMICAANEFPLTGENPVTTLSDTASSIVSDWELFGGKELYLKAAETLVILGSLVKEPTPGVASGYVLRAHRSLSKAWSTVSLRSIEPINYVVVDISHYSQQGRMDCVHDEAAVLDTLPYSRVFYHAHPGAIITHRGRKYKIISMTRPPLFSSDHSNARRNHQLAAFAKPCQEKFYTRPLSNLIITVVNQMEMVQMHRSIEGLKAPLSIGGRGIVCVKRSVHGYKRLSLVSRQEISRTELSLPSMEYETFGLWLDSGADHLMPILGDSYGLGVHALCHALLAVAPHVCPGLCRSDLQCDHSFVSPTCVMLFDERAGGSGACQSLWKHIFKPEGLLAAAIDLLENCPLCGDDKEYDGGCPECLHDSNCIKFNQHLSRSAGDIIGRWILSQVEKSDRYIQFLSTSASNKREHAAISSDPNHHKLKMHRQTSLDEELYSVRSTQFVVGRAPWPMDESGCRHEHE